MKIEAHSQKLPVKNHDGCSSGKKFQKHSDLLSYGCKRALIVGSSGCGKTNAMISLLEHPNGLRFGDVYLYSKTLHQEKYEYLRKLLTPLTEIGYHEYSAGDDIIPPKEAAENSVIIFDDVVCDSQSIIREYFSFGRHRNIDCFYLCQTYSSIPKQLVRDNSNFLILFKQDYTNLKHVYDDHVNIDMSIDKFKEICSYCWRNPHGFLVINKDCDVNGGRYREGFDNLISIKGSDE